MAVTVNASTSSGLVWSSDLTGSLQLQNNGTTKLTVDSTGAYGQLVSGTAIATTSGTGNKEFTGIPSWVKRITVVLNAVGTNGTAFMQIQVGAGSIATTGYTSTSMLLNNTSVTNTTSTTGFIFYPNTANLNRTGQYVLTNVSGNIWVCSGQSSYSTTQSSITNGVITLGGVLDRVCIATSDTYNAGSVNILYEG